MIVHLKHHEIDQAKWDDCIKDSFNGIVYAYSWYLNVVTKNAWEALIEDDYSRVFPFFPKQKWGVKYVFQPFATQQLGVFSKGKLDARKVDEFLFILKDKFKLINIYLNVNNRVSREKFQIKERITYQMDLIFPYEAQRVGYKANHKRNIKKAKKENLSIVKSIKPSLVIQMFKDNKGKNLKSANIDYSLYQELINEAMQQRACITYGVVNEARKLIGGVIFLYSHNRIIYSFAAVNDEGKQKRAMFLLLDEFIKENQGKNLVLDFEGSNDPNVAFFYRGFGSVKSVYINVVANNYPQPMRLIIKKYMGI